jgi:uncharacterized protein (TIGR00369 family)
MARKDSQKRGRTVTWVVPVVDAEAISTMSGLDLLRQTEVGRTPPPPVWRLVDFRLVKIDEGHAVFEIHFAEHHLSRFGRVQGGIECPVLDAAMGYAVHSTLPAGAGYTTLELKVNYLRPITLETGLMRCVGSVIHKGNRIALAEAQLLDREGLVYAHAVSTCLILEPAKGTAGSAVGP